MGSRQSVGSGRVSCDFNVNGDANAFHVKLSLKLSQYASAHRTKWFRFTKLLFTTSYIPKQAPSFAKALSKGIAMEGDLPYTSATALDVIGTSVCSSTSVLLDMERFRMHAVKHLYAKFNAAVTKTFTLCVLNAGEACPQLLYLARFKGVFACL